ncbi:MAG: hypothetical protein LBB24_03395 [Rickettsiales bacterium]|jgi:hypothetical protein|nr:hypothetical protein [Rickettsiales bacterium]
MFVCDVFFVSLGLVASRVNSMGLGYAVDEFVHRGRERVLILSFLLRMLALATLLCVVAARNPRGPMLVTLGILLSRLLVGFQKTRRLRG